MPIFNHSSESMHEIEDKSIHLLVTSPPYNIGKDYDNYNDKKPWLEYFAIMQRVFSEAFRVLVDGGRLVVNVANLGRKPYTPLSDRFADLFNALGFSEWGRIYWAKTKNPSLPANGSCQFGSWMSYSCPTLVDSVEIILVFVKGQYKLPVEDRYPADITKQEFMEFRNTIWYIGPKLSKEHPAIFPDELAYRAIKLWTGLHMSVLDPFMGTGSTLVAAKQTGRKWYGYDVSPAYCAIAESRLSRFRGRQILLDSTFMAANE